MATASAGGGLVRFNITAGASELCLVGSNDSTAGGVEEGAITLELCRSLIDDCVLVSESEIKAALKLLLDKERWAVEGAAALAVAAYLQQARKYAGQKVAILLCGRNIPLKKLREAISS